jgi:hypothetical protein
MGVNFQVHKPNRSKEKLAYLSLSLFTFVSEVNWPLPLPLDYLFGSNAKAHNTKNISLIDFLPPPLKSSALTYPPLFSLSLSLCLSLCNSQALIDS